MGQEILYIKGVVEIKAARGVRVDRKEFKEAIVKGDNEDEVRANFCYSKTVFNDKQEKIKRRELQKAGRVTLVSYEIIKRLGRSVQ